MSTAAKAAEGTTPLKEKGGQTLSTDPAETTISQISHGHSSFVRSTGGYPHSFLILGKGQFRKRQMQDANKDAEIP